MEILIFIVLIALSAFFSGAETAFFSLHQSRVRILEERKRAHAATIRKLKANPQLLLVTILIGNNVVNVFTAAYATIIATRFFESAALGIATGATTFFILVFGEILPKSFAYSHNELIAQVAAKPIYILSIIFRPVAVVLLKLQGSLNKLFNIKPRPTVTEEEIRVMAKMGLEHGAINPSEQQLIENIFKFDDLTAGEIMTAQQNVDSLNGGTPVEQVAYFVSHAGYSRYPVTSGTNGGSPIGYVHVNQIMKVLNSDARDRPVEEFASPIEAVSEDMLIERIFRIMKRKQSHMFLVHRAGVTDHIVGLVTLEDILEQIVGEIEDETDLLEPPVATISARASSKRKRNNKKKEKAKR